MSSPDPSVEQARLEEAIERDQQELRVALSELKVAATRQVSPRAWVAEHPWVALSVAAAIGLYLGRR